MTQLVQDRVASLIAQGIQAAQESGALPSFEIPQVTVERPRQAEHGDYASPVCLRLAKEARMAPREIAARVVAHMAQAPFAAQVEIAGPGYINLTLDSAWLAEQVLDILTMGAEWGHIDIGHGRRVQVEFVSANPVGPITVASTRNAVIGDTLASILAAAGYQVEREYYINDAGTQIRKFGESVYARYAQALGRDEAFPEDGYQGQYVVRIGQRVAEEEGQRYLNMPRREAIHSLTEVGIERMLDWIRKDLASLGITFDTWFSEQKELRQSGLLDRMLDTLRRRGNVVERDDAVWFTCDQLEDDAVLIRSPQVIPEPSERPTYFASDVAYMWNKLVERGFDQAIYVWGADHHGDVPRVKAAAAALGLDPRKLVIILYQMVNLKRGGEDVRMSKRAGKFVTLEELRDEVGSDAIRFMLLTCSVDATIDFDLELAVEQSDKNPVYYVQYAHARIASILRHAQDLAQAEGKGWDIEQVGDVSLLTHESELVLIRKMLEWPEILALAAAQHAPHHLTFYAKDLASTFHAFYRDCRVVDAEAPDLTQARLSLVKAVRRVLAGVLHMMGMSAPERM